MFLQKKTKQEKELFAPWPHTISSLIDHLPNCLSNGYSEVCSEHWEDLK